MAQFDIPERLPRATHSAPHVRDGMNVKRIMAWLMVALLPPALFGVYNTGYQANLAMERLGVSSVPGWRGQIIDVLGAGYHTYEPWAAVVHGAVYFVPVFLTVMVTGAVWTSLFAYIRGRRTGPGIFTTALVVSLLLPATVPLWLAVLGMSFGMVLGREIFGGFGRNVFNPAVVTLVFLHIAYPAEMMADRVWVPVEGYADATPLEVSQRGGQAALAASGVTWMDAFFGVIPGTFGGTSALACLVGAAILLWTGIASWRVIAGVVLGAIAASMAFSAGSNGDSSIYGLPWTWQLVLGSIAFGTVYLAAEPVTAAATDAGRWIYGALIGILAIVIRVAGPAHSEGIIFAILLGNIFAPAIDHLVCWNNIRRRKIRYAR